MLKEQKTNVFVLGLMAILGILLVAPTAKAGEAASNPIPADGATDVAVDAQLGWTAGVVAAQKAYFGTDATTILARDLTTFIGNPSTAWFNPGQLEPLTTYYWAIDVFPLFPLTWVTGPVWSFTTVGSTVIPVEIDIKPGSDPNPINPGSNGLVPVAIFSSPEFDATQVDPTSVSLAGAGVAVRGKGKSLAHVEDVNGNGLLDLVVQVEIQSFDDLGDGGTVELTGITFGGEDIVGYDEVVIVPPDK